MAYKQQKFISLSLEAGKSKVKVLEDLVSSEGQFPDLGMAIFSLHPHMAEGMRDLSRITFIRTLIFMRATLKTYLITSQYPHLLSPYMEVRFQHMSLGRKQTFSLLLWKTAVYHVDSNASNQTK